MTDIKMKVKVWLKDGSILQDWTLVQADVKIDGLVYDIKTLDKIDDAFLYTLTSDKIYRERISGTVELNNPILVGSLKLALAQIQNLTRTIA